MGNEFEFKSMNERGRAANLGGKQVSMIAKYIHYTVKTEAVNLSETTALNGHKSTQMYMNYFSILIGKRNHD